MEVDPYALDEVARRTDALRTRIFRDAGESGLSWEMWDYPGHTPLSEDNMKAWFVAHFLGSSTLALALGGTG